MTIDTWLIRATERLTKAGVETARLDALVLLEDVLGDQKGAQSEPAYTNRAHILAHGDEELPAAAAKRLDALVARRADHEPLAYIRGKAEFYGREFAVGPDVLVPRPESETIIDLLRDFVENDGIFTARTAAEKAGDPAAHQPTLSDNGELPKNRQASAAKAKKYLTRQPANGWKIADVGAGSGILGVTAALELPATSVTLLEIDPAALEVARRNTAHYDLDIPVIQSDLLSKGEQAYDILLCNLPYVPSGYYINKAARHEPELALFAGADGLDLYRALFTQIDALETAKKPLLLICESLPGQHDMLSYRAHESGYEPARQVDFVQAFVRH